MRKILFLMMLAVGAAQPDLLGGGVRKVHHVGRCATDAHPLDLILQLPCKIVATVRACRRRGQRNAGHESEYG